ncbi:putative uncharacterized protein [Bacteroides sp. CAG:1060]|nr:putative uncharacterized protein [Bacteroides sp. CAG:1060]
MKKITGFLALCAMVLAFASCSASRAEQMKLAEKVSVSSNPEVLALVGDKIPADITVTFPAKYFHPAAILEVTPVLVYEGGEQVGKTFKYQGEKVKDNYRVIASNVDNSVTEKVAFDYVPGVEKSYLELRSVAYYKNKTIEIPAIKVADGCNVTQLFASTEGEYSFKKDNYKEVISESAEGQVMYDYNSATIKRSELRSDSVKELQAALDEIASDPRYTVTGTRVVAYASPEGGQQYNAKLSDKRAESAKKAWDKVTGGMKTDDIQVKSMGQDWDGFKEAVQNSNIEDKELILRVLSMYSDPAVRESEIRNMSKVYTEINKNVFPELRRARFIADVDYKNFSDDELKELADKAVDVLDEEGLLRVASITSSADRKAELYKMAVSKFGSDRAQFNLAVLSLNAGKPDQAASLLKKVSKVDGDVNNALGVCELQKGNLDAAADFFRKAGTTEAKANLGTIDILKGNYDAAVKNLEGTGSHNLAVAYILTNQLDKAEKSITCKCARSNYLRAVIAARRGNSSDVEKYLAQTGKMKEKAEKDVEFADFR